MTDVLKKEKNTYVIYSRKSEVMLKHLYKMIEKKGGIDKLDRFELMAILKSFMGKILDTTNTDEEYTQLTYDIIDVLVDFDISLKRAAENDEKSLLGALKSIKLIYNKTK